MGGSRRWAAEISPAEGAAPHATSRAGLHPGPDPGRPHGVGEYRRVRAVGPVPLPARHGPARRVRAAAAGVVRRRDLPGRPVYLATDLARAGRLALASA